MSAAFIERQNAYFAALDRIELDEESSSSEEEEEQEDERSASEEEEEEDVPKEQIEALNKQRVDEEATCKGEQHAAIELSHAAAAEGDEHVLVGDSSRSNEPGAKGQARLKSACTI